MTGDMQIIRSGAGWVVVMDGVAHSWVDPDDPTCLEFGYMLRMADYLNTIAPPRQRMRVIHVGGAAMTMPRYVAAKRPTSPQIVMEPTAELTRFVRAELPLAQRSGIKVRPIDGRTGISRMPDDYAKVIIVDAFADATVPADLVSREFLADVDRVLTGDGLVLFNAIDIAPLDWTKRLLATFATRYAHLTLTAESATLKGRRHGNLLIAASHNPLPLDVVIRRAAGSFFPHRVVHSDALDAFIGGAEPFCDADAVGSPQVERGLMHFE